MKKYTVFALILIMALGMLTGCRNRNQNSTTPSASQATSVPTTVATTPDTMGTDATAESGTDGDFGGVTDSTNGGILPDMTENTGTDGHGAAGGSGNTSDGNA